MRKETKREGIDIYIFQLFSFVVHLFEALLFLLLSSSTRLRSSASFHLSFVPGFFFFFRFSIMILLFILWRSTHDFGYVHTLASHLARLDKTMNRQDNKFKIEIEIY